MKSLRNARISIKSIEFCCNQILVQSKHETQESIILMPRIERDRFKEQKYISSNDRQLFRLYPTSFPATAEEDTDPKNLIKLNIIHERNSDFK